jgi:spoIIIJ-associated protein
MKELEISAKTVEEATKKALEELGVGLSEIEITVLNEGKSGILGLGAESARIRVKTLDKPEPGNEAPSTEIASITQAILTTLLDKMGVSATVTQESSPLLSDEEEMDSEIAFNVEGEDLGVLIGRRGQTLACLQYIVRLMVAQKTRNWVPISIDVEGYKARRYESLKILAHHVAEQVRTNRTSFKLEPMPAFERRIIHITLAHDPDVTTESTGEGEARKVVVIPKRKDTRR